MSRLTTTFGIDDVYPKSAQVLLWIATAMVGIITATWALVGAHEHVDYIKQREFSRVIDAQYKILDTLTDLRRELNDQSKIVIQLQEQIRWQQQQER